MFSGMLAVAAAVSLVFAACGEVLLDSGEPRSFGPGHSKSWDVALKPEWGVITVKTRMKTDGVVCGKENWMTARVPMSFHDATGGR